MIIAKCGGRQHTLTTNDQTVEANVVTTRSERCKFLKELQKEHEEQKNKQERRVLLSQIR